MNLSRHHYLTILALLAAGCGVGGGEDEPGTLQQGLGIGDSLQAESFSSQQGTALTSSGTGVTSCPCRSCRGRIVTSTG